MSRLSSNSSDLVGVFLVMVLLKDNDSIFVSSIVGIESRAWHKLGKGAISIPHSFIHSFIYNVYRYVCLDLCVICARILEGQKRALCLLELVTRSNYHVGAVNSIQTVGTLSHFPHPNTFSPTVHWAFSWQKGTIHFVEAIPGRRGERRFHCVEKNENFAWKIFCLYSFPSAPNLALTKILK